MLLYDAHELAHTLMGQFLPNGNWHFEFDDAVKRFGCCHWFANRITLSRELTLRNERAQVEDVIRHEIAHALAGHKAHHGAEWKRMCAVTGANRGRCYGEEVETPEGNWNATCPWCDRRYSRVKAPKHGRRYFCVSEACVEKFKKFGRWSEPLRLTYRHKNEMFDPTAYATETLRIGQLKGIFPRQHEEGRRAAIESLKAQMRREQEMGQMQERIAELEKQLGRK